MIDLHSHLLFSVDDGAATLDESLALARRAVEDGIQTCVLTPHIHPGRYANVRSGLVQRVVHFQNELDNHGIPLKVRLGGEVRLSVESLELLLEEEIPFLGTVDEFRVMLLEFPHQMIPVGSQQFIEKLLQFKVRPLIAHPERNKAIMAQPEKLGTLINLGCWAQLTAGSIAGRFGDAAYDTAVTLLEREWVHVIATDAHNLEHRPPILSEGVRAAAEVVGAARAQQMVVDWPAKIIGL